MYLNLKALFTEIFNQYENKTSRMEVRDVTALPLSIYNYKSIYVCFQGIVLGEHWTIDRHPNGFLLNQLNLLVIIKILIDLEGV